MKKTKRRLTAIVMALAMIIVGVVPGAINAEENVGIVGSTIKVKSIDTTPFPTGCSASYFDGSQWVEITGTITEAVRAQNLRVVLGEGCQLASHTQIWYNGSNILANGDGERTAAQVLSALTSSEGYTLDGNASPYEVEHLDFTTSSGGSDECYIAWLDSNGVFRYHHFTGLAPYDSGIINFFSAPEVIDEIDPSAHIDATLSEESYEFLNSSFDPTAQAFATLTTGAEKLAYVKDRDNNLSIDPCGAYSEANAISTNGDRMFTITIFGSEYEGVTVGGQGTYIPGFWRAHSDTIDISGSTEGSPVEYTAYLLDSTITLRSVSDDFSAPITAVEPVGVPAKAVTVTARGDGVFALAFHSNYYDSVVFKVTTDDNQTLYMRINRITMQMAAKPGEQGRNYLVIYYPSSKSYSDYTIVFNATSASGGVTSTTVTTPEETAYDSMGGMTGKYEVADGKGLKCAWYALPDSVKSSSSFNVNVISGTAAALTSDVYPGTLVGSGDGATFVSDGHGFTQQF